MRRRAPVKKKGPSKTELKRARLWTKRSYSVYRGMVERMKLKKLPPLKFTVEQFREWAKRDLRKPCRYCHVLVTEKNFGIDHEIPLLRGGEAELSNCAMVCKSCNTAKGEMTAQEFYQLLELLGTWEEAVRMDVYGRLKFGAQMKRLGMRNAKNGA